MTSQGSFKVLFVVLAAAAGCSNAGALEDTGEPRGASRFAELELDIGLAMSCGDCHASNMAQGGLGFADLPPDEMRDALVGVPSKALPSMPLVSPGDLEDSFLVRKLRGDLDGLECAGGCGNRMPIGNYPYAEGDRLDLEQWIAEGAE